MSDSKIFQPPICVALAAGLLLSVVGAGFAADTANGTRRELTVMTYNLRYASSTGANAWPKRRPLMRECILGASPDVFGTQEGVYGQLKDLAADLPDYDWIGLGRDGGSKGEFMAVFFRKSRLEPMAIGHFWLSDTPEVTASSTWGNSNRRMVTWIRFRDLKTDQQFYLFNTHFDHEIQPAREKSAALVRQRMQELKTTLPILLIGDFNAAAGGNKAYQMLVNDGFLLDTWSMAREKRGDGLGTFNGFHEVPRSGVRIDWILCRGKVAVDTAEIVTFNRDGKFPSDHCPVVARLRLEE
jgi:endonuclease/exonuclease/phosphatase family metal-dependent hydrolase